MSIVAKKLTKHFGSVKAVDDVSFQIEPGEVTGLIGPNGAGKTTTIRMMTGLLFPTTGVVEINGKDVRRHPHELRRLIGYLPEENPLYANMDVIDYLKFIARLQGVSKDAIDARLRDVIDQFGLSAVKHMDIKYLSKGYRQRVGLAQTMIHDPQILIFDEPINGLDPNQVMEFRRFVNELGKQKTVIFSTHVLSEVQALCNRVIILGRGKILADTSLLKLQEDYQDGQEYFVALEIQPHQTGELAKQLLEQLKGVKSVTPLPIERMHERIKGFHIQAHKDIPVVKEVYDMSVRQAWTLVDLHNRRVKVEDIFHKLTKGGTGA